MIEESEVLQSACPERAPSHATRSPMVLIPQDPETRAQARAEILMRVTEFITTHKGHAVSHCRQSGEYESLHVVCETCHETLMVIFEYEEKGPVIAGENVLMSANQTRFLS
jgi:hypothetical protein